MNFVRNLTLFGCLCALFASCGGASRTDYSAMETVVYQERSTLTFEDLPFLRDIEIIPLETTAEALTGESPLLIESGGEYFLVDRLRGRIVRVDSRGKFLNAIDAQGRGPNEYMGITAAEVSGDSVRIYCSRTQAEYTFSKDGRFGSKTPIPFLFRSMTRAGNNYWAYLGYRNQYGAERLVMTDLRGETMKRFLPSEANVLVMDELDPVFVHVGSDLLLRESISDQILHLSPDSVSVAYEFDFGKYSIPEEYYRMSDPFAAMELLMGKDFATIKKWFENDSWVVAEVFIQRASDLPPIFSYAFKDKGKGEWYWVHSPAGPDEHYLAGGVGALTSASELLLLVAPYELRETAPALHSLFVNPEAIASLKEDDNYVILKCRLN